MRQESPIDKNRHWSLFFSQHPHILGNALGRDPKISRDTLRQELADYYGPYATRLLNRLQELRQGDPSYVLVVGVSAIQGAGKTTQGAVMEDLLSTLGYTAVSLSIDDHYLTHEQLTQLRNKDPRFIQRGVTHDISLAIRDLTTLKAMRDGQSILTSSYYKGAHANDGDRYRWISLRPDTTMSATIEHQEITVNKQLQVVPVFNLKAATHKNKELPLPENMGGNIPLVEGFLPQPLLSFLYAAYGNRVIVQYEQNGTTTAHARFTRDGSPDSLLVPFALLPKGWRVVDKKPDFIFYDGWMLRAQPVEEDIFDTVSLPGLEDPDSRKFAKDVNTRLADYERLWEMIDYLNILYVPDFKMSIEWRDQQEQDLRKIGKGKSRKEIEDFVLYFWRSVHPEIYNRRLAENSNTDQVTIIDNNHSITAVLFR